MNQYDDPTDQWALIFNGDGWSRPTHTRQEWAQIAEAITTADARCAGMSYVRGDSHWCHAAVDAHAALGAADAYRHLRGVERRWTVDEHLVRTWLGAPVVPPQDEAATVLDAERWLGTLNPTGKPEPAELTLLVDHAQTIGVVGAPHHKVSVLRWVDEGVIRNDAFIVVLWPPDGPARASNAIHIDDLVPPAQFRTDLIVGTLTTVAGIADQLLAATAQTAPVRGDRRVHAPTLPAGVDGHGIGARRPRIAPITGRQPNQPPPQPPAAKSAPTRRTHT
jgi:hypothetical protein